MNLEENETETETEEIGETDLLDVTQKRKLKRINLDKQDTLTVTEFSISKTDLKKLDHESVEKEISKGAIIRKLIREHLAKEEKPTQPNPETTILDEEIEELLNFCTAFQGGFQTTGDKGFFMQFTNREWKLSDLTDNQFIVVCNYLKIGYEGFWSAPTQEEYIAWIENITPTKEQVELTRLILQYNVTLTEEDTTKTINDLITEIKKAVGTEKSETLETTEQQLKDLTEESEEES